MLTQADAERIAHATHSMRPTWDVPQIMAVLADERIRVQRHPQDAAAALAWLAMDSDTREPTRLLSGGAWWGTATAAGQRAGVRIREVKDDDCDLCTLPKHAPGPACEYRQRNESGPGVRAPAAIYQLLTPTATTAEDPT